MHFSKNLKRYRELRGLTQQELARKVGISWEMISRYENNKSFPAYRTLVKLAEVLGVSMSKLLDTTDVKLKSGATFADSGDYIRGVEVPLVLTLEGVRTREDLDYKIKTTTSLLWVPVLFGETYSLNMFAILCRKNSSLLKGIKIPYEFANHVLIFERIYDDSLHAGKLYLLLNRGVHLLPAKNVLPADYVHIYAVLRKLVIDF